MRFWPFSSKQPSAATKRLEELQLMQKNSKLRKKNFQLWYLFIGIFWGSFAGEMQNRLHKSNVGVTVLMNSFLWPVGMVLAYNWFRKRKGVRPISTSNYFPL